MFAGLPPASLILGVALLCTAVAGPFVWIAVQYVRAWRTRRPGHRPEPMAWLRAIDPNHAALPTPTRQAPMMPAPSRWTLGRVAIYAAQAVAIGWLTWTAATDIAASEGRPPNVGGTFLVMLVIVAFTTAVLTNLWAWAHRQFQGSRSGLDAGSAR